MKSKWREDDQRNSLFGPDYFLTIRTSSWFSVVSESESRWRRREREREGDAASKPYVVHQSNCCKEQRTRKLETAIFHANWKAYLVGATRKTRLGRDRSPRGSNRTRLLLLSYAPAVNQTTKLRDTEGMSFLWLKIEGARGAEAARYYYSSPRADNSPDVYTLFKSRLCIVARGTQKLTSHSKLFYSRTTCQSLHSTSHVEWLRDVGPRNCVQSQSHARRMIDCDRWIFASYNLHSASCELCRRSFVSSHRRNKKQIKQPNNWLTNQPTNQ